MKTKILLVSYGKGGHQAQMTRLLDKLEPMFPENLKLVTVTDSKKLLTCKSDVIENFTFNEARDKYSTLKTLILLPKFILLQIIYVIAIYRKYQVVVIVTTGPGVSLIPALIAKLLGTKVVAFESWSRFNTASYTGKLLYRIADLFFIQNKPLKSLYPKAIYKGRL